jgi:thioredoxin-dependent peroxiredoxin
MPLPQEGAVAPDFSLPNQDNAMVRLADLGGRHVVFWWYPKADTPG